MFAYKSKNGRGPAEDAGEDKLGVSADMLYTLFAWQQTAMAPLRLAAVTGQHFFSASTFPFVETRTARAIAAACELVERSTRTYGKPPFGIDSVAIKGERVPVAEKVVAATPFGSLIRFERVGAERHPRVMLVAPLSGHHATLLRGTVQALLPGHDVYITDWHDAKAIPVADGRFDLDDYIDQIIAYLRKLGPGTHVIAVCQPSVPVLAAASLMAAAKDKCRPRSLVLMGGPIDTRINPTKVNRFAARHPLSWFKNTVVSRVPYGFPGFGRYVYPGFLQLSGFMSMNMDRHLGAHLRMFEHLVRGDGESAESHRKFYDEYMSVMDLTAEFYLQTVELVFQKHVLPKGEWISRNAKVEPAAIRDIGLMTIEGELDDISAPGQTLAAQDLCRSIPPSKREHVLAQGVGHYGIFNGRRWREAISPRVAAFIARHD
jgi:poly(3-hydroxybutyrate) depolymerase